MADGNQHGRQEQLPAQEQTVHIHFYEFGSTRDSGESGSPDKVRDRSGEKTFHKQVYYGRVAADYPALTSQRGLKRIVHPKVSGPYTNITTIKKTAILAPQLHRGTKRRFEAQRFKEKTRATFQLCPNTFQLCPIMDIFDNHDSFPQEFYLR
jgi:hypothetical protein